MDCRISRYFEHVRKDNGVYYIRLRDDTPDILSEFMDEVHKTLRTTKPNAWVMRETQTMFDNLCNFNDLEDFHIYGKPDYYELISWLSNNFAVPMIDYAHEINPDTDFMGMIRQGQDYTIKLIFELVQDFIKKHLNEFEE